jgi:prepilin signal peptidase PulO-like enzyme (type II secretory pathway)
MMGAAIAALFGLAFGSFLNAALDRLPRRQSLLGRSRCEVCARVLGPHELVPVLSYAAQRGRCRGCGSSIGLRTPLLEIVCAGAFALVALGAGSLT